MSKTVLILGAGRYYQKGIETAGKIGYRTIAIDRNPDAPGLSVADLGLPLDFSNTSAVLELARKEKVDGIIPLNDFGVRSAAYVSRELGLPGITPESADRASFKYLMRQVWQEQGLPNPEFKICQNADEIKKAALSIGFPCILKPGKGVGGGSRGVIVVRSNDELEEAISFSLSFYNDHCTLVEACVDAVSEHSAELLLVSGKVHLISIGDKIKTPLPYRVDKSVLYPSLLYNHKDFKELEKLLGKAASALGLDFGAAHVEFAMTASGPVLFELGARCGGGGTPDPIVPWVTGVELFAELVRILAGDQPELIKPQLPLKGCSYLFLIPRPGTLVEVRGQEKVSSLEGILDFEVTASLPSEIMPVQTGPDRAGFIIAGGKDRQTAFELAAFAERQLEFHYDSNGADADYV